MSNSETGSEVSVQLASKSESHVISLYLFVRTLSITSLISGYLCRIFVRGEVIKEVDMAHKFVTKAPVLTAITPKEIRHLETTICF